MIKQLEELKKRLLHIHSKIKNIEEDLEEFQLDYSNWSVMVREGESLLAFIKQAKELILWARIHIKTPQSDQAAKFEEELGVYGNGE